MPLHMQAMEHMALGIIMHRFFIISAAVLSSQVMVQRMPPAMCSIFMVQRGIMVPPMPMFMDPIIPPGIMPGMGMPGMPPIMGMLIMLGVPPVVPMFIIRSDVMLVLICGSSLAGRLGRRFLRRAERPASAVSGGTP